MVKDIGTPRWLRLLLMAAIQLFLSDGTFGQTEGEVRLMNGPTANEGRPEIFHNGVWLSLCGTFVSSAVPQIICKQLGFPTSGARMYYANSYGSAPGETYRSRISCYGTEATLSKCTISGEEANCDPIYTLGVSCNTSVQSSSKIRLRGGSTEHEGIVEILEDGVWGTICRYYDSYPISHLINAHVICRQLFGSGYGGAYYPSPETPSRFGLVESGAIVKFYMRCNGDEDSIFDCSSSDARTFTSCRHEYDATVKCVPVPEGCTGYFKANTGTVTSPGYPIGHNYTDDAECVWKIETTSSTKVSLSFPKVLAHETGTVNYVRVIDSNYQSRDQRISYGSNITDSVSISNIVFITKKTLAGNMGVDFQATWSVAINCNTTNRPNSASIVYGIYSHSVGYPGSYLSNLDCYCLVEFRSEFTISISFSHFNLDNAVDGDCRDYIEFFNGSTIYDNSFGRYCGSTLPAPITSLHNTMLIHFHTDDVIDSTSTGYDIWIYGYEPDPVIINLLGESGTFASPDYPAFYTREIDYVWNITVLPYQSVSLFFSDFDLSCTYSIRLEVRERYQYGTFLIYPCGMGLPTPVFSNDYIMYIRLFSFPGVTSGNRFNASWTADCRRQFTTKTGTISSPEFPRPYPENLDCVYLISLETGYYITLTLTSLNLDSRSNGICQDSIEIRDGSSEFSPLIVFSLCQISLPFTVSSTRNSLWIKFHSDNTTNAASTGFQASYTSTVKECQSQSMTASTGKFYSPNYPLQYPRYTYCVWTITVPSGIVLLTFDNFAIGSDSNHDCSGAYVRIYDGQTVDASTVIETLCGNPVTPIVISNGRSLTVVLNSFDISPTDAAGFQASYTTISSADTSQHSLFPFGSTEGDASLGRSNFAVGHVTVPAGIPFGNMKETEIYISNNGIVSFGTQYLWPELPDSRQVICAYCAYVDNSDSNGGIYYQLYDVNSKNPDIIDKATKEVQEFTQSSFNATVMLVVTWERVKRGRYTIVNFSPNQDPGEATFQLAVISDGSKTFALVYYAFGAMSWTYSGLWSYVSMGVSDGNADNYQRNLYTKTKRAYTIDLVLGNTGHFGTWLYKVGEVPASPESACDNWYNFNQYYESERAIGFSQLPECPCSRRDVWQKTLYLWVETRTDDSNRVVCYRMNLASSNQYYPYGKECCYSLDNSDQLNYQQLIMSPPYAGSALAYNPVYGHLKNSYQEQDKTGHDSCCHPTVPSVYCLRFYRLRPIGECRADIPFRFSWLFCDPHFITLDEREYTFNGYGEYILLKLANVNFVLQGRTSLTVTDNGTVVNSTVFTAYGAEENGTRVFVQMDPNTNKSLIIYGDNTDYTRRFQDEGDKFLVDKDKFTMTRDDDSLVVTFSSGIALSFSVGIRSLTMGMSIPEKFRGQTVGLMGNYNGVKEDDFVLPNGTVLSDTLSDREIHQLFGIAWAVTESTSILRYGLREGPSNYSHADFRPMFLDEVPASDREAAENKFGATNRAAIYDYLATGSETFALGTKQIREMALKENADIKNTIPILHIPPNVTVRSDVPFKINVSSTDLDDGDMVTYKLVTDGNGTLKINEQTGEITATVNWQQPVKIQVYALDSKNAQSPVRTIPIVICSGCSSNGQCDFSSRPIQESAGEDYFQQAVCSCTAGWTGAHCTEDYDDCLSSPCHPLQNCTDHSPAQQQELGAGFICSACPEGYDALNDQPSQCLDVDECENENLNDCEFTCNNTAGSFVCSCPSGYRLTSDLRTCADVNECAEKSDNCQHICSNTKGSYECQCREGFTMDGSGNCAPNATTQTTCVNSGCSQGCRAVRDTSANLVPECFCNQGYDLDPEDGKTCRDHNECEDGLCSQVCNNTVGSFTCSCYGGYQLTEDGRTCSPCPSLSYGPGCLQTCMCNGRAVACHHVTGCVCQKGWTGSQCQDDIEECKENPDVCDGEQVCSNINGSYICACREGYSLNEDGICQDVDECNNEAACDEQEICINVPGSFYCSCLPGYAEKGGSCTDIDECQLNIDNCQQVCANVDGSYNCDCNYGYRLTADRTTCSQVSNPCPEVKASSCDHGCTLNSADSAVCFCNSGYRLQSDGQSCSDIDECSESLSLCSDTCVNMEGGFTCSCPPGMFLSNDGKTCIDCPSGTYGTNCSEVCSCGLGANSCNVVTGCECMAGWTGDRCDRDVNECAEENVTQGCLTKKATCANLRGSYRCECDEGYMMGDSDICQDVDECASSPCGQICENNAGSYRCLCHAGFSLDSSTGECNDVDECLLTSTHGCTQSCDNSPGSYWCSCDILRYVLSNDGITCVATTLCTQTDCDNNNNGGCYIGDNNEEKCFCNSGYTLDVDGKNCTFQVVDWCSRAACQEKCQVSDDGTSFTCSCGDGLLLSEDGRTCRTCKQGTYGRGCQTNCSCVTEHTASCDHVDGTCSCKPGWQGVTCTDDVDECQSLDRVCPDNSTCSNTVGSYFCTCNSGYVENVNGSCAACPRGNFGENCKQTCSCNMDLTSSCDHVDGTCSCKPGSQGVTCADDVDECQSLDRVCPDNSTCNNTVGSYFCTCNSGYLENVNGSCTACPGGNFGENCKQTCDCNMDHTSSCDHVDGTCSCKPGSQGVTCADDVDECQSLDRVCPDNSTCNNTVGSYFCTCNSGYLENVNGSCTACPRGNYGENCKQTCNCITEYTASCDHVKGTCICQVGWQGSTCNDEIMECQSDSCDDNATCNITSGKIVCTCDTGYAKSTDGVCSACPRGNFGENCKQTCSCNMDLTSSCDHVDGTCSCKPGSQGVTCADDVDECQSLDRVCPDNSTCNNTVGSYFCTCNSGYLENVNGSCTACDQGTFGVNCETCLCNTEHTASCDHVKGTCTCRSGWQGSTCNEKVEECLDDSCGDHATCSIISGEKFCVCETGYAKTMDEKCTAVGLPFIFVINVNVAEDKLNDEQFQKDVASLIFNKLYMFFKVLLGINVHSLRQGSVIIDTYAIVPNDMIYSSAASLAIALVKVVGQNATIDGQTGPVGARVGGLEVTPTTSTCEVFIRQFTCGETETCHDTEEGPECRESQSSASKVQLMLVIGLSVGIPCVIVLICIVGAFCYRHQNQKRRIKDGQEDKTIRSNSSSEDNFYYPGPARKNSQAFSGR